MENGVLPKKCFSLGEADEKRFYLECRLLVLPDEDEPVEEPVEEPEYIEEPAEEYEELPAEEEYEEPELYEEIPAEPVIEEPAAEEQEPAESHAPKDQIDYARIQAEAIVQEANNEAGEILAQARREAEEEAERIYQQARDEGYQNGYAEGMARAVQEGNEYREELAKKSAAEIAEYFEQLGAAFDRYMDDNVDDLRDLAIAVAEKVISVSLRSSTEVIGKMVQAALDKRKQREWVHIYISESDAKRMGQLPASIVSSISALSDRVRIIPMADDESGTCVIEMPDEIIDASVSTQLNNIRSLLSGSHGGEVMNTNFNFEF